MSKQEFMLARLGKSSPSVNHHYFLLRLEHKARGPRPFAQLLSEELDSDCMDMAVAEATEAQHQERGPFLRMQSDVCLMTSPVTDRGRVLLLFETFILGVCELCSNAERRWRAVIATSQHVSAHKHTHGAGVCAHSGITFPFSFLFSGAGQALHHQGKSLTPTSLL